MLQPYYLSDAIEAGVDEAGRGALAGPVAAAAVILPHDYSNPLLNDSKQLTAKQRETLRDIIKSESIAWAIALVPEKTIDEINILNASILAMHNALNIISKKINFNHIIVDGNRFKPYNSISYTTIVKGDAKYMSIAAASILAKTERDHYMCNLHNECPYYQWNKNMGYPTKQHRLAIEQYGSSPYHRMSFQLLKPKELTLFE
ncbi:MAG: ribonuclease HII [Bacteroidales bacterium]|nr:ribonuclease HII [Bacteroidales bacterium]MDY5194212.1 ribonuclease HII [Candidatus Aphodosoma sp.]